MTGPEPFLDRSKRVMRLSVPVKKCVPAEVKWIEEGVRYASVVGQMRGYEERIGVEWNGDDNRIGRARGQLRISVVAGLDRSKPGYAAKEYMGSGEIRDEYDGRSVGAS